MSLLNRGYHKDTTPRIDRAVLERAPQPFAISPRFTIYAVAAGFVAGFLFSALGR